MIGWFEKNKTASIFMVIIIAIEIYFFSSLPGTSTPGGNPWIPRAYHFIVFFLFSFFLFMAIKGNKKIKPKYILIVFLISLLYALLDEIHQLFVPGRDANIIDILTDTLGILFATAIYSRISKKHKK